MTALKTMMKESLKLLWLCGRYIGVCALMILGTLSLATGKFPPPIKEVYQSFAAVRSSMNFGQATQSMALAQQQQKEMLAALDDPNGDFSKVTRHPQATADADPNGMGVNAVSDKEKIKALEYEVALLKAKLARAEREAYQLQARQPSSP